MSRIQIYLIILAAIIIIIATRLFFVYIERLIITREIEKRKERIAEKGKKLQAKKRELETIFKRLSERYERWKRIIPKK